MKSFCALFLTVQVLVKLELSFCDTSNNEIEPNTPSRYYTAAVVEYDGDKGNDDLTPGQILLKNTAEYESLIIAAAEQNADIIVFPEYGLTSLPPTLLDEESAERMLIPILQEIPDIMTNPCIDGEAISEKSEVIHRLSCAARSSRMYVVVNLGERVPAGVEAEEEKRYNVAIVFDRQGKLLIKYRKYNLFAEPWFEPPSVPNLSVFTTDFGVDIGVFICFDVVFAEPAKALVSLGVKHFAFPTAWVDEFPFALAIQAQQIWASSTQTTLLASGYHRPEGGSVGSGIYLPSGEALDYTYDRSPNATTRILYGKVPIDGELTKEAPKRSAKALPLTPSTSPEDWFYFEQDLSNFTSQALPITTEGNKISLCSSSTSSVEFCCKVKYNYKALPLEESSCPHEGKITAHHKLVVFSGNRTLGLLGVNGTVQLQVCGILRCLSDDLASCSKYSNSVVSSSDVIPPFDSLRLSGGPFTPYFNSRPGFTALDTDLKLIPMELFDRKDETKDDKQKAQILSNRLQGVSLQILSFLNLVH